MYNNMKNNTYTKSVLRKRKKKRNLIIKEMKSRELSLTLIILNRILSFIRD